MKPPASAVVGVRSAVRHTPLPWRLLKHSTLTRRNCRRGDSPMNPIHPNSEPLGPGRIGQEGEINRRDFLGEVAGAVLGITGVGATVVTVEYLSPNVLFEPPTRFRVGHPDDYPVDSVTYIRDQQVYIVRMSQGFCAVSAVCTHLGCITEWRSEDQVIVCPCH